MGREIRRVPPNWKHPLREDARDARDFRPCYDQTYEEAASEWMEGYANFKPDEHSRYYWEYDSTPNEEWYRPAFQAEPTWFQVYETVSEGTPVSPPFATKEELLDYLSQHGDFWYQKRTKEFRPDINPSRDAWAAFLETGHAFSMVIDARGIRSGVEACADD